MVVYIIFNLQLNSFENTIQGLFWNAKVFCSVLISSLTSRMNFYSENDKFMT
jgi:hypothetical protein